MFSSSIQIDMKRSEPIHVGDGELIVTTRVVSIRLARVNIGFIWNTPVSVAFRRGQGSRQTLPIRDETRRAQFALIGIAWLFLFIFSINQIKSR